MLLGASAHASELDAARKRTTELESQLGEKNTQLGDTEKERARLAQVETDLQAKIQKLTNDLSALKVAHAADLQRLLDAREHVEGHLMMERDSAIKRYEDVDAQYQDQI